MQPDDLHTRNRACTCCCAPQGPNKAWCTLVTWAKVHWPQERQSGVGGRRPNSLTLLSLCPNLCMHTIGFQIVCASHKFAFTQDIPKSLRVECHCPAKLANSTVVLWQPSQAAAHDSENTLKEKQRKCCSQKGGGREKTMLNEPFAKAVAEQGLASPPLHSTTLRQDECSLMTCTPEIENAPAAVHHRAPTRPGAHWSHGPRCIGLNGGSQGLVSGDPTT